MIGVDAVSITSTLGIEDFNDEVISVSPNPTQNFLNIQTKEIIKETYVYDMLGKKVTVNQLSANSIDVSTLAKGIYLLKVVAEENKIFSSKFIKE